MERSFIFTLSTLLGLCHQLHTTSWGDHFEDGDHHQSWQKEKVTQSTQSIIPSPRLTMAGSSLAPNPMPLITLQGSSCMFLINPFWTIQLRCYFIGSWGMHSPTFTQTLTIHYLLTRVTTWPAFSHHTVGNGGSTSNSLEDIHDGIHVYIRGNGQMSSPTITGKVFLLSLSSFYLTRYYRLWPHLFLASLQHWQATLSWSALHHIHGFYNRWEDLTTYKHQIDNLAENETWFYSIHFVDQSKKYPRNYGIEAIASPYYEKWLPCLFFRRDLMANQWHVVMKTYSI